MKKEEKYIRKIIEERGYNADDIFSSGMLNTNEKQNLLAGIFADIVKSQTNNSTKVNKSSKPVDADNFYMGFLSDTHSKLYLAENYLKLLNCVQGKCVITGDMSNGSNHFKGHDSSINESINLSNDLLSIADVLKRYPDMFVGYVEGNHDQWISEGTSLFLGYIACKMAGVDEIYAKNVQLVTQKATYDGKKIPFNFLIIHGEGMPADIVSALKKSLEKACKEDVDAIIFGHTHKLGGATTTILNQNIIGNWTEKQVTSFNPGTFLETSDYADKAGYPGITPFDGSVMRCSVVPNKTGKGYKKCIDIVNIMNIIPEKDRLVVDAFFNKLRVLENRRYTDRGQIDQKYAELREYCDKMKFELNQFNNGQHIISINGTSDLFAPETDKENREKIKEDLLKLVNYAKDIPNLSVIINGDFIYDYNKGYIAKKDYSSKIVANLQELAEILKPIADKVVAINSGKMEIGIMNVEYDKCNGRLGDGKHKLVELANYAAQTLQLDDSLVYAQYDKDENLAKKLAIQNDEVNKENQETLDKEYAEFMKRLQKDKNVINELEPYLQNMTSKNSNFDKMVKEILLKKLRTEHKILDISNPYDQKLINEKYPLSDIDLRKPHINLLGNILCKLIGTDTTKVVMSTDTKLRTVSKMQTASGENMTVWSYYAPTLPRFLKELQPMLNSKKEPPDIVVVNTYANNANGDLQEYTTSIPVNYINKNGTKKQKDVLVIGSGSFAYNRVLKTNRVSSNLIYKVVEVDPIFNTLIPSDSINYSGKNKKRLVLEKYNCESLHNKTNPLKQTISDMIDSSQVKTLVKFHGNLNKIKSKQHVKNERYAHNQKLKEKELVKEVK